ncbi:hypothetical protein KUCAC02_001228, partial [Chaenocephalus aceratus]
MDVRMDRRTDHTGMSERHAAGWRGREREHLPAGLRSGHGFCESGAPLRPVAGQEGTAAVPT